MFIKAVHVVNYYSVIPSVGSEENHMLAAKEFPSKVALFFISRLSGE